MSSTTTTRSRAVTRNGPERIGALTRLDAIREAFLQPRRVYLHARRPKDARIDYFRRDLACGKVRALENLYDLSAADVDDGAPITAVTRPYFALIAELEERARQRDERTPHEPFSLLPLHQRETRAEAALNEAQNVALAHEDDPAALATVEARINEYLPTLMDLAKAVTRKLSRMQGAPKAWA